MSTSANHSNAPTRVILLGDEETVAHRSELAGDAAGRSCVIADAYGFPPGATGASEDLTDVEAVVAAVGRAIAGRMDIWVPFPGPDLLREQHVRRISLVLQRHGLNLRLLRDELSPVPVKGAFNEVDFALRCEVHAVDALDQAALAAEGATSLGREIELALVGGAGRAPVRRAGIDAKQTRRAERYSTPMLPPPAAPWPLRQPLLKRYAQWLVHGCGVTQAATARVLNSTGQRTVRGRHWQASTVSALLNGRYDRDSADSRRPA